MNKFMNFQVTSHDVNDMTEDEKQQYCDHLHAIRAKFTECCEYPKLGIWGWDVNDCDLYCATQGVTGQADENGDVGYCCGLSCQYYKMQLISLAKDPTTGLLLPSELYNTGYLYSFMLSVGNDTQWEPIIKDVVDRCYNQFASTGNGYYCEIIPYTLWSVAECCYMELFMKCPNWNPQGLASCALTYEYAVKCIKTGYEVQYDY